MNTGALSNKKPEIIAPGGSFLAACTAFKYGADAVYAGLKSFSARAHAQNLSEAELSKLKRLAVDNGKKIYVTMNTVIKEDELVSALKTVALLCLLEIDGIVVQDLGFGDAVLRYFPEIRVHASTQMAAHNPDGVAYLAGLGYKRVILPRELTFEEIKAIREKCPDVELETFIHGAMCYSFSGLCLASGMMLGRSGNRGDCGQICRSWFEHDGKRGYFFSMNDLALLESVVSLSEIGIDGFKIEGRMKPPEYAGLASAFYREVLASGGSTAPGETLDKLATVFSRKRTRGFFENARGANLVSTDYPGHRGIKIGCVTKKNPGSFAVTLKAPISLYDGILFFSGGNPVQATRFGIRKLTIGGKSVFHAEAGSNVEIWNSEISGSFASNIPGVGKDVFKISGYELKEKISSTARMRPFQRVTDVIVTLSDSEVCIRIADPGRETKAGFYPRHMARGFTRKTEITGSKSSSSFTDILSELFKESGESRFLAMLFKLENKTGLPDDGIFIRPSALKRIKNEFYASLYSAFESASTSYANEAFEEIGKVIGDRLATAQRDVKNESAAAVPRESLSPRGDASLPFVCDLSRIDTGKLASKDGRLFLPLAPLSFDSETALRSLCDFAAARPDSPIVIGLSNAGQLSWAKKLEGFANVSFFIDFFLYCANRAAFLFFISRVRRLLFQYFWIEGSRDDYERLASSIAANADRLKATGPVFEPPLFVSRACFFGRSIAGECVPGCSGETESYLTQNGRKFKIIVRDCITYLLKGKTRT